MRSFIMATEQLMRDEDEAANVLNEAIESGPEMTTLQEDLEDVIFKLRAFMESSGGEYGFGVQIGMERAAEMIEHALKRHRM